jgi:hypothetical protein
LTDDWLLSKRIVARSPSRSASSARQRARFKRQSLQTLAAEMRRGLIAEVAQLIDAAIVQERQLTLPNRRRRDEPRAR